ncbi:uncharacterized protein LAESUDRAFT_706049 [Laetiporus sulphureus 93-53]|uniref:Alpha/beta-hydrolase n=1 Tax=Laetiporus sulphureus 93-53 TaxID=1314785 RepID=A0A165C8W5_9APHY|nr:uncharacterized protein LAESUDRAFT_706049 [Laetiporus sulphureus 93-53]KZT02403.1 hypothetical protein LAESUDRAFT_706049 [Laetiporus sulphureus 93-53]
MSAATTTSLPPFLQPLPCDAAVDEPCVNAVFPHPQLGASAHAIWWPPSVQSPPGILLFIPGNPGLVEFYTPFLTELHNKCKGNLAILAHAHLGHSPTIPHGDEPPTHAIAGLTTLIQSAIEALDAIQLTFPSSKLTITAHSMGCWVTLQVLKARPNTISSVFLLFPTICHIANTPNGRSLSWLFKPPFPRLIAAASVLAQILPLHTLSALFSDWPHAQILVLRSLLRSPSAILACLNLAHDEMNAIQDLDTTILQEHQQRLHFYFAEEDHWVGEQKETILKAFHADAGAVKIVHGLQDIPHAFCINHGVQLAEQCFKWLQGAGVA